MLESDGDDASIPDDTHMQESMPAVYCIPPPPMAPPSACDTPPGYCLRAQCVIGGFLRVQGLKSQVQGLLLQAWPGSGPCWMQVPGLQFRAKGLGFRVGLWGLVSRF